MAGDLDDCTKAEDGTKGKGTGKIFLYGKELILGKLGELFEHKKENTGTRLGKCTEIQGLFTIHPESCPQKCLCKLLVQILQKYFISRSAYFE